MAACFRQRSTQHFRDRESVILTLKKFNWFKKFTGFKWTDFLSAECGLRGADSNEKKCSQLSHCTELIEKITTTTISPRKKGDLEALYFDDYPFHSLLCGIITNIVLVKHVILEFIRLMQKRLTHEWLIYLWSVYIILDTPLISSWVWIEWSFIRSKCLTWNYLETPEVFFLFLLDVISYCSTDVLLDFSMGRS